MKFGHMNIPSLKTVKSIVKRIQNQYPEPDPPPNKPDTCQFSVNGQKGFTHTDLNGASSGHIQTLQTMASNYTKLHSHEQLNFHISKCWKTRWNWSRPTTPEHQQHMCDTEGLKAMVNHCKIATFSNPGQQKQWIRGLNLPISSEKVTTQTQNLASTVCCEPTFDNFSCLHNGHGHTKRLTDTMPSQYGNRKYHKKYWNDTKIQSWVSKTMNP